MFQAPPNNPYESPHIETCNLLPPCGFHASPALHPGGNLPVLKFLQHPPRSCSFSFPGNRKIEGRAPVHCTFSPNASTMPADNLLHNCQAYTGPLEFLFAVQSLEDAEQLVHVFHVDARAAIAYIIDVFMLAVFASHLDDSPLLPGRKLDRVGKKVHPPR